MKNLFKTIKEKVNTVKGGLKKSVQSVKDLRQKLAKTKAMQTIIRLIKIPFIGYLLLACILNFVLEMLSRHSVIKVFTFIGESPMVFLYNAFIIFVTLSLVMFAKRKVFATVFVCAVWIISAFANYIVLCFRTTPFSAIDVLMIRNVMTMLDKYMTKWQMVLSVIGIALLVLLLVYLYVRLPKTKHKRNPFRASAYVCMCIVLIYTLTKVAVETQTISDNFGNLAYAYNDYGFAYCFSNSIIDVGISKPKDYSQETIEEIVDGLEYDKSEVVYLTKKEAKEKELEASTAENNEGMEGTTLVTEEIEVTSEETTTESDTEENTVSEETSEQNDTVEETNTNKQEAGLTEETTASKNKKNKKQKTSEKESSTQYFKNKKATRKYPNVIVIQLESIFDTKYMDGFIASENPMPVLARLKRKYSSGLFTVPAVGAGTANTEFEVQTGMSTQFFGAGEYPFKTIMREKTCDSMAYDFKRLGYATAGFHNNDATFYERYIDYFNLGFDTFTGMEHMYLLEYTPRGWAKDNRLDELMLERLEKTSGRDYITTITVQCHGRYPKKHTKTLYDLTCHFEGKYEGDTEKEAAWEYYINMCKETDDMIKDLITKLEALDEPTVVFMYGDHVPSLNLEEDDLTGISLYQTEWVMWDNIGLEVEKKDLMAYQASTYIFNRLNLQGGLMQNFHNQYMESEDQKDYLHKLELLEYDTLYGNNYAFDGQDVFPTLERKMGIRDIQVNNYRLDGKQVTIYGIGFNKFSTVYIDGKEVDTQYLGYTSLSVPFDEFKDGKEIYVAQEGDDHVILSTTDILEIKQEDVERMLEELEAQKTATETEDTTNKEDTTESATTAEGATTQAGSTTK